MENINAVISENLKRLREREKLSLDAVARLSSVSKSMLGQIERGEVNPTISTLWRIADGLKVPFSALLSRPQAESEAVEISALSPLVEDGGRFRNYPVFPFSEDRRFEVLYLELDPGATHLAAPHPQGTQEFVTVFEGELLVRVGGEVLRAENRCALRFRADREHRYESVGSSPCRLSMVIAYPL